MGLVELPIYKMADGSKLVVPRVLARTLVLTRQVVALPEGLTLQSADGDSEQAELDPDRDALSTAQQRFWAEFLSDLRLDDPEQQVPKPAKQGYLAFMLPAPGGSSWLTVYRDIKRNEVGVTLSCSRNSAGEYSLEAIVADWTNIQPQLGGTARLASIRERIHPNDSFRVASLEDAVERARAFNWLSERVNTFINVLRPLVRSTSNDYQANRVD